MKHNSVEYYKTEIDGYNVTNTYVPEQVPAKESIMTYVLNGGSYNGSTDDILESYPDGTVISIHEAPTREGYRFTYWKGSEYQPGDQYTVEGDHTFTGQWEKEEEPTPEPTPTPEPEPEPGPEPSPGPVPPKSGDNTNLTLWIMLTIAGLIGVGVAAFGYIRKKKSWNK